jgi:hypothetical protein
MPTWFLRELHQHSLQCNALSTWIKIWFGFLWVQHSCVPGAAMFLYEFSPNRTPTLKAHIISVTSNVCSGVGCLSALLAFMRLEYRCILYIICR